MADGDAVFSPRLAGFVLDAFGAGANGPLIVTADLGSEKATDGAVPPEAIRRADPEWDREQVVTLSDSGIRLESVSETTDIPWTAVRRASETPEIVLIHIGAARVLYLPVRIVTLQADLAALRHLLPFAPFGGEERLAPAAQRGGDLVGELDLAAHQLRSASWASAETRLPA